MPSFAQNHSSSRLFADFAFGESAFSDDFHGIRAFAGPTAARQLQLEASVAGVSKLTSAFPIDGVGDLKPPVLPQFLITTDDVPDAPDTAGNTNPTLTATPAGTTIPIVSTIDTIGDQDFYKVTLTAGTTYEFGLYSYNGGPNAAGLTDPYLELYAANGTTFIVSADGGANTVYNEANSGFDVLLTYTPTVSGTYYVNARAYSNSPLTPTGDSVGDYQLFVRVQDPNDPDIYHPYYEPSEPLYAIDWGTQVNKINQSARNPDGDEGTRDTGNAPGTPVYTSLVDIPALAAAQGKDISGKNVITIYFAKPGDVFVSNDPTNPGLPPATITAVAIQDFEYEAVWTALAEFENVADVIYLEVQDRNHADFIYTSYQGTPGPGVSLLGSMSPPDESDEGLAQFNSGDSRWNARDLAQGGFSFVTLIHEFGHGHGLAHPHDNGGRSGIMNGVEPEGAGVADYTTGDYGLNQGVFTMMSYEDGWQDSPHGNAPTNAGYGYLGGLMAFDIAAIQDKYGVNEDHATGHDTYTLKDVNAAGTYYYSIWDAGGSRDEIVYGGSRDAVIDLRPASLKYEVGGGGFVSYVSGIYGGFTIAKGVTIEHATSGSGNDRINGNGADNRLDGGAGNDTLISWNGIDTLIGGDGNDVLYFGKAFTTADFADGGAGRDVFVLQGNYTVTLSEADLTGFEAISLQSGSNRDFGDTTNGFYDFNITTTNGLVTAGQQMIVNAQSLRAGEDFTFDGSAESDGRFLVYGGHGVDDLTGGDGKDIFIFEGQRWGATDTVDGGGGRDAVVISGFTGVNNFTFGANSFANIESISLNNSLASDPSQKPSYNIVLHNGNVTPGGTLIVNGSSLAAGQVANIDGRAVLDGDLMLFGGGGNDVIRAGAGDDLIVGGGGQDSLFGGGGADTFRYDSVSDSAAGANDLISDFVSGTDTIDLSGIDANTLAGGDQAFSWIGSNAFSGTGAASAGELRHFESGGYRWIEGDTNGDGGADFAIRFQLGTAPLVQGDFVL